MASLRKYFFTAFIFLNTPLFAVRVPTLEKLIHAELFEFIKKDPNFLAKFKTLYPILQQQYINTCTTEQKAYLCSWLQDCPDVKEAFNVYWEKNPFEIHQATIDRDLMLIQAGKITGVKANRIKFTVKQFEKLISFQWLKTLELNGVLTNEVQGEILKITHLKIPSIQLPKLNKLILSNCELTLGFILNFLDKIPNVTELDLSGNPLKKPVIQKIARMHNLMSLDLCRCNLTADSIKEISKLTELIALRINKNNLSSDELQPLSQLKDLEFLSLKKMGLMPHLYFLLPLQNLTYLYLEKCNIPQSTFSALINLGNLEELTIADQPILDSTVEEIIKIPKLHALTLHHVRLTDIAANHILSDNKFDELCLTYNGLTHQSLNLNQPNESLVKLDLSWNELEKTCLARFQKFTRLNQLDLSECKFDDTAMPELLELSKTLDLEIKGNTLSAANRMKLELGG